MGVLRLIFPLSTAVWFEMPASNALFRQPGGVPRPRQTSCRYPGLRLGRPRDRDSSRVSLRRTLNPMCRNGLVLEPLFKNDEIPDHVTVIACVSLAMLVDELIDERRAYNGAS